MSMRDDRHLVCFALMQPTALSEQLAAHLSIATGVSLSSSTSAVLSTACTNFYIQYPPHVKTKYQCNRLVNIRIGVQISNKWFFRRIPL